MSQQLIEQYYNKVERIKQYGGSNKENQIRAAFEDLIERLCIGKNLELIPNLEYKTNEGAMRYPDGTFKDSLRQDWGYWESKDEYDSLDDEIQKKIEDGYPTSNIIFEDGITAVLIQRNEEVGRAKINDPIAFEKLLNEFFSYETRDVQNFHKAIERFEVDLPDLLIKLRQLIEKQAKYNNEFAKAREKFLALCQRSINPDIVLGDIREMIIQHILTEDIFITVFNDAQYHRENNISHELTQLVQTFFKGEIRRNIIDTIDPYYKVIKAAASNIENHHEKQRFLKVLYESFYRTYNPLAADRLGIIYTPEEIVRFMVDAANYLTLEHFGRLLSDDDVEILDPACGTGTFITEIIEKLPKNRLQQKYQNEIHCNEVALLPYYVANLNIEYTYRQKMGHYAEFKNICFVDTLDNLGFIYHGKQYHLIDISAENLERIKRQNDRRICVIIGNPPYNANQMNENENNKNREYDLIDERIKETYVKYSTAQKTKTYDMYARFLRWSTDRLNDNGVIAFVSNSSFIDKRTYDGFRKVVADEFSEIHIIDMKGNARTTGERRRKEGGNVFSDKIKVGIAVYFLVKKKGTEGCKIFYNSIGDCVKSEEKLFYLRDNKLQDLAFEHIIPDKDHNWINQVQNDWSDLLPLAPINVARADTSEFKSAFRFCSNGVVTARDNWVYDFNEDNLRDKVQYLISFYNNEVERYKREKQISSIDDFVNYEIKWSASLKQNLAALKHIKYSNRKITRAFYKPYVTKYYYFEPLLSDRLTQNHIDIFGKFGKNENLVILVNLQADKFKCLATDMIYEFGSLLDGGGQTVGFPLYCYDKQDNRVDNITDYCLNYFRGYYKDTSITKISIFWYIYSILHHTEYRRMYEVNLRRYLPHIPLFREFWEVANLGKQLMNLHIGYNTIKPYNLKRIDDIGKKSIPNPRLLAHKSDNSIEIDSNTSLVNIPHIVWEYTLGNLSAMEWILEYYKEHKISDPTIQNKFNNYRLSDYKEEVIDLLKRVCAVSIETVSIVRKIKVID